MPEKITGAFTPKQNMLYKLLFGEDLPGYLPPTGEERLRAGVASKTDSIATGLLPRATGPSEYEGLLQRLPEGARAKVDSMKAGLLPRASKGGTLSPYEGWIQELAPEEREKVFKTRAGLLPRAGQEKEIKRESILSAGGRYAEKIAKTRRQMEATTPVSIEDMLNAITMPEGKGREDYLKSVLELGRKPLIEKESPAYGNLVKTLETYGDSAAIARRALEKFSPDSDMNELVGGFQIAKQALSEYQTFRKQGVNEREASRKIQEKYGYDLETLRGLYYVETGK